MFDHFSHHPAVHIPSLCTSCSPLLHFVAENRNGFLDAGALLGGRKGTAMALAVVDGLSGAPTSTRRLSRDLDALLDLLKLEHVHDDAREEADRFAQIDPHDPVVEEICLLADGLDNAIDEWNVLHEQAGDVGIDERAAA